MVQKVWLAPLPPSLWVMLKKLRKTGAHWSLWQQNMCSTRIQTHAQHTYLLTYLLHKYEHGHMIVFTTQNWITLAVQPFIDIVTRSTQMFVCCSTPNFSKSKVPWYSCCQAGRSGLCAISRANCLVSRLASLFFSASLKEISIHRSQCVLHRSVLAYHHSPFQCNDIGVGTDIVQKYICLGNLRSIGRKWDKFGDRQQY